MHVRIKDERENEVRNFGREESIAANKGNKMMSKSLLFCPF